MIQPGQFSQYGALPVPQVTPEMLSLVRKGSVYSLAVVYHEGIPVPGPLLPYTLSPRLRHGDLADIRPASAAAETITMTIHCGTHIDALCHIGEHQDVHGKPDVYGEPRLYAGQGDTVAAREQVNYQGQKHMSVAEMPPIVTRGVLLDVAAYKQEDVLADGYVITADDIEATLAAQATRVQPGTAVGVLPTFTGWELRRL
jgi:hypothetical protein